MIKETELNWESVCVEDIYCDITYTTENPLILKTESVFKEGDKIKRIKKEERFYLISKNLLQEFLDNGNKSDIYFFQKGLLKLFRKFNTKQLINYSYKR